MTLAEKNFTYDTMRYLPRKIRGTVCRFFQNLGSSGPAPPLRRSRGSASQPSNRGKYPAQRQKRILPPANIKSPCARAYLTASDPALSERTWQILSAQNRLSVPKIALLIPIRDENARYGSQLGRNGASPNKIVFDRHSSFTERQTEKREVAGSVRQPRHDELICYSCCV
jgi:hypothetical protein